MPIKRHDLYFNTQGENPFAPSSAPKEKQLGALELGEHWATQGLMAQALFLAEYSKDPKRQGAWLLAVAACTANDETTQEDISRAMHRGLSLEEAARIALFTNSGRGAVALHTLGVDWSRQTVIPPQAHFANDHQTTYQPNQALIEYAMDPKRASGRYNLHVVPRLALEIAMQFNPRELDHHDGFMDGILEVGVDPAATVFSQALGMRSGQVKLLSVAIANRAWGFVENAISRPLDQEALDEALLACAMSYGVTPINDERAMLEVLTKDLLGRGAKRDRPFEFCRDAMRLIYGSARIDPYSIEATARQWFVLGALSAEGVDPQVLSETLCPTPLPKLSNKSWGQWAMEAYDKSQVPTSKENTPQSQMICYLLDADPMSPGSSAEVLGMALGTAGQYGNYEFLDAFLACEEFKSRQGTLPPALFVEMLSHLLDPMGESDLASCAIQASFARNLWLHPRLDRLACMMSPEDITRFKENLEPFLRELATYVPSPESDQFQGMRLAPGVSVLSDPSESQLQATQLAFTNFLSAFQAGVVPKRQARRTL